MITLPNRTFQMTNEQAQRNLNLTHSYVERCKEHGEPQSMIIVGDSVIVFWKNCYATYGFIPKPENNHGQADVNKVQ